MTEAGTPHRDWDDSYAGPPPPWDIGRPQPAFVRLAEAGMLTGSLLDVGCGTGEHTILAAQCGARALGIDLSPRAIEIARRKAAERSSDARSRVLGVLRLDELSCASATTSPASGVLGGSPKVSCTPHSVPAGGSFRSLPTASTSTRASAIPIAEAGSRMSFGWRWGGGALTTAAGTGTSITIFDPGSP